MWTWTRASAKLQGWSWTGSCSVGPWLDGGGAVDSQLISSNAQRFIAHDTLLEHLPPPPLAVHVQRIKGWYPSAGHSSTVPPQVAQASRRARAPLARPGRPHPTLETDPSRVRSIHTLVRSSLLGNTSAGLL